MCKRTKKYDDIGKCADATSKIYLTKIQCKVKESLQSCRAMSHLRNYITGAINSKPNGNRLHGRAINGKATCANPSL